MSGAKQDFVALTTFRALGALCVIEFHAWPIVQPAWPQSWVFWGFVLWPDYFFALSGFILTHVYNKTLFSNKEGLYNFYVHRIARIYPLHVFVLLVLIGYECLKWLAMQHGINAGGKAFTYIMQPKYIVTNLLLIQAWGVQHINSWNYPAWSISAEFACYLIFPAFVRYKLIDRPKMAALLCLLSIAGLIFVQTRRHDFDVTYDFGVIRALSSFTLGCILYQYRVGLLNSLSFMPPALLQIATLAGVLAAYKFNALPLIYIPLWLLLIASFTHENTWVARLLSWRPMVQLGEMSYSIYMVHVLILFPIIASITATPSLFKAFIALPPLVILFAILGSTCLLSLLTYNYIEKPGRAFVRKRFGRKNMDNAGYADGSNFRERSPNTCG